MAGAHLHLVICEHVKTAGKIFFLNEYFLIRVWLVVELQPMDQEVTVPFLVRAMPELLA